MQNKVSIEHFLNKIINPVVYSSAKFFPLFLVIQSNGKKVQIKSHISEYLKIYSGPIERLTKGDKELALLFHAGLFSEPWLKKISKEKKFPVFNLMADDMTAFRN